MKKRSDERKKHIYTMQAGFASLYKYAILE